MGDNFHKQNTCDDFMGISESDLVKVENDGLLNYLDLSNSYENIIFGNDLIHPKPNHWNHHPILEELNTDYECEVTLNSESSGKSSWMYSQILNKVFIKMDQIVVMNINYKAFSNEKITLRAMVVFTAPEDLHLPVLRCAHHYAQEKKNDNVDAHKNHHILRCRRVGALYVGNVAGETFGDRLSLTVPLGGHYNAVKTENNTTPTITEAISFQFVCQNSCTSGINRKCTSIVFTFENEKGDLLGRKTMQFKVCSAPKRDKDKEEEAGNSNKRRTSGDKNFNPPGKRVKVQVKTENATPNASPSPPLNMTTGLGGVNVSLSMPNIESMLHVLRCARNEVTGNMLFQEQCEAMVPYIRDIEKLIEETKKL